ncbi:YggS family pyridoxal phosphate-dependent enzyme [Blattabacterium punctulatus]|uniref:YggS family pyridoxal phosphate-dependent enzyme n=1 Tax=Blattabacterium punctulatus TaxID=164514 RepID=UPI000D7B9D19|nr:YggS family pyridoxal phosphate-dependent enzyme [Blattabacterium punctulatus]AWU44381.1 YggS family pyridoxal phosphate-dependent enzyme [Blattabacterium punctulatus]AWU45465.1 YggS family pyridoxal phosphate-dependent enzyme [Blattabacterium punctulatus]
MKTIEYRIFSIKKSIPKNIKILAVSKNQDISSIKKVYQTGHRDFGENYIQEMILKYKKLPKDIRWHMIGRIQSNKLKYIVPFINLIHSVQRIEHLKIINKEALKYNRIINCLLQIKICNEKNKSGITNKEIHEILENNHYKNMKNVKIIGLMGMATFHGSIQKIRHEFDYLNKIYNECKNKYKYSVLSMGMSRDYPIAIECGSTLIRLGTFFFGKKNIQ